MSSQIRPFNRKLTFLIKIVSKFFIQILTAPSPDRRMGCAKVTLEINQLWIYAKMNHFGSASDAFIKRSRF